MKQSDRTSSMEANSDASGHIERPQIATDAQNQPDLGIVYFSMLMVAACWGVNIPILKLALVNIHPSYANAIRFSISATTLLFILLRHPKSRAAVLSMQRRHYILAVPIGVANFYIVQVLFIAGIARSTGAISAILVSTGPVWTALIGHSIGIDHLHVRRWIGLALAIVGSLSIVLIGNRSSISGFSIFGCVLIMLSQFVWGVAGALSKPGMKGSSIFGMTLIGLIASLPLLWLTTISAPPPVWKDISIVAWACLLFSGAISGALCLLMWNVGIQRIGPVSTSSFSYLIPFFGVVFSAILLGENIHFFMVGGGLVIVIGLVLVMIPKSVARQSRRA